MNAKEFRKELEKLMPGYSWTIHKKIAEGHIKATGTKSSGFNRLSTLSIERSEQDGKVIYKARSSGYGRRAPWLHTNEDGTMARALRGLQDHYEKTANTYLCHAKDLEAGRHE